MNERNTEPLHTRRTRGVPLAAFAAAAWLAIGVPGLHGQASTESPIDVVRSRNEAVSAILETAGDPVDDATLERLKDVINGFIDFQELSRRALGPHWDARTEQEKTDFVDVFRQLIRNSSVRKLGVYRADSVTYNPPEGSGDEITLVTVAYRDEGSAEVVYEMHRVDGEWRAYDVIVDGSSTVRTYRDSFNQEIRRGSYEAMYAKLVDRLQRDS
jgi:phospholipid transport system substrate-binding protein